MIATLAVSEGKGEEGERRGDRNCMKWKE